MAEAEGVSDIEELNKVLERAVTLRNMMKNPQRVDDVAQFVAKHFRETIEPMGYKAFLVAVDREACALYKEALDKHLPAEYSEVVISTQGKKDSERLRKFKLTEDEEKDIRKRFRKPDEQPKILIVTEKLLTGFDAPILYCMYLDKPMRDHVLLQAIARVNRPYEDEEGRRKTCGFVLDFVGIFDNLEKALAFDSQDVAGRDRRHRRAEGAVCRADGTRPAGVPADRGRERRATRRWKRSWSTSGTRSGGTSSMPISGSLRNCTKSSRRTSSCGRS